MRFVIKRANGLTRRVTIYSWKRISSESSDTNQCKHRVGLLHEGALPEDPKASSCFPRLLTTTHLHMNRSCIQKYMQLSFPSDSYRSAEFGVRGDLIPFLDTSLYQLGWGSPLGAVFIYNRIEQQHLPIQIMCVVLLS